MVANTTVWMKANTNTEAERGNCSVRDGHLGGTEKAAFAYLDDHPSKWKHRIKISWKARKPPKWAAWPLVEKVEFNTPLLKLNHHFFTCWRSSVRQWLSNFPDKFRESYHVEGITFVLYLLTEGERYFLPGAVAAVLVFTLTRELRNFHSEFWMLMAVGAKWSNLRVIAN